MIESNKLKASDHVKLSEAFSGHLPKETKENTSVTAASLRAGIRTAYLPNASQTEPNCYVIIMKSKVVPVLN
jgi:hypothetical protein